MKERLLSWNDYIYIGMALAVMIAAGGGENIYQLILVIVFFVITGIEDNIKLLTSFIKKYPIFAVLTGVWTVYFSTINGGEHISYGYAIMAFFVVFAGYCASASGKVEKAIERLWVILFAFMSVGIVNYIVVHDYGWRMSMFFTHHLAESYGAVVLGLVSMLYINDTKKKIAGIVLAFGVSIATLTRFESAVLVLAVVIYLFVIRKKIALLIHEGTAALSSKKRIFVIVVIALFFMAIVILGKIRMGAAIANLVELYKKSIASIGKDIYLDYFGDLSVKARIGGPVLTLDIIRDKAFWEVILGGGALSGYYKLRPLAMVLLRAWTNTAGPAENALMSLFSDFGMSAFVLYLCIFVSAIKNAIKSRNKNVRSASFFLCVVMILGMHSDMEYWMNMIFPVFIMIGIYLSELSIANEGRVFQAPFLFSCIVAVILLELDNVHSWIRTSISVSVMKNGSAATALCGIVIIAAMIIVMWCVSVVISEYVFDRRTTKKRVIIMAFFTSLMIAMIVFCNVQNSIAGRKVASQIDVERDIIKQIKASADGEIYNDTFPSIYNAKIGEINGTLFSGASLAARENATVIVSLDEEAQRLIDMGFLYQPISEWDAVYSNDPGVISALKRMGFNPTGYYSIEKQVDLERLAAMNGLKMNEDGALVLNGTKDAVTYGPDISNYWGKYTATFGLMIKNGEYSEDYPVCALAIKRKDAEEIQASVLIKRSMFDDNGKISYPLTFDGVWGECDFRVTMYSDELLEISTISYKRSPEYDTHVRADNEGNVIREEYYDLEGNPIEIDGGYHGVEYEYSSAGDWTKKVFLGMNYEPTITNSGYAIIERELNGDHKVTRERYYDDKHEPIALGQGQAVVEHEYDENMNCTVDRYYDTEGAPTLYNGQFWYVYRTYDDNHHIVFEQYYGIDNEPTILSDGSTGYRREYDDEGNVVVTTYLGIDGKPVINTSGYAILRRMFNENNRIVREDYYDEYDNPVVLSTGQAAVEYEYDEAGNRTVNRYYDVDNKPVLYGGQYWYNELSYNDLKQSILEKFYGTDGNPILQPNGAAGYQRSYDYNGNVNVCTYLGNDGKPTTNIWKYSTWRRTYNEERQVIREEYYGIDNKPVELSGGQGAVEYEYDDAGNVITERYFDGSGNSVLYAGEFWYVVRTYNGQKQIVHEDYYGLDNKLILRPAGYCSVDIRYDESGALVGKTFYNLNGEVVAEEK